MVEIMEIDEMTKIAYNTCYGGFSLSRKAVLRARELSGNPRWGDAYIAGDIFEGGELCKSDFGYIYDVPRHDPVLIQVIEELGEEANGGLAKIALDTVPKGTPYSINEYDGRESVVTSWDFQHIAE